MKSLLIYLASFNLTLTGFFYIIVIIGERSEGPKPTIKALLLLALLFGVFVIGNASIFIKHWRAINPTCGTISPVHMLRNL